MGGRWKNFNFKIVGNRFFLLATVARLRVEFSALLNRQKTYTDCIHTWPKDTKSNQTQFLGSSLGKRDTRREKKMIQQKKVLHKHTTSKNNLFASPQSPHSMWKFAHQQHHIAFSQSLNILAPFQNLDWTWVQNTFLVGFFPTNNQVFMCCLYSNPDPTWNLFLSRICITIPRRTTDHRYSCHLMFDLIAREPSEIPRKQQTILTQNIL